jgi:hypothetical protein
MLYYILLDLARGQILGNYRGLNLITMALERRGFGQVSRMDKLDVLSQCSLRISPPAVGIFSHQHHSSFLMYVTMRGDASRKVDVKTIVGSSENCETDSDPS